MVSTSFGVEEPSTDIFLKPIPKSTLAIFPASVFCNSVDENCPKPLTPIT